MYQFTGHVSFFVKGRYWKKFDVRLKCTTYTVAARRAVTQAKANLPARTKVEGVDIHLERLGKIAEVVTTDSDVEIAGERE